MSNRLLGTIKGADFDTNVIKAIKALSGATGEISMMEFEMIFEADYPNYTEELNYTGDLLTQKNYYQTSAKTDLVWQVDFGYDINDLLITKDIARQSPSQSMRISFTYDVNDKLTQKDRAWL